MSIRLLAVHHGGGVGGAPVSLLKLLARLAPSEFSTRVVFTEPGDIEAFSRELGVASTIVRTGGAFFYSAHARLAPRTLARFVRTFPSAVRTAQAFLRRERPDVVHLNTSVLFAWAVASRRERLPIVWTVREVLGPNPTVRAWQAAFVRRHARTLVAISEAVRESLDAPRARVVYNAVDLDEFSLDLLAARDDVRAELGLRAEPTVLMIGSVQHAKGHFLALEALAALPDVRLVLVTGGVTDSYRQSLRGQIKTRLGLPMDNLDALLRAARAQRMEQRVVVTGFRRDVARVLTAADVVLFPSLQPEGFGRPIIEAMAMQRPVVATDVGPSRELLGSDAGCLVSADPAAVAGALRSLLADPARRQTLGEHGRARVRELFSLDRQVATMSDVYRQAAAGA